MFVNVLQAHKLRAFKFVPGNYIRNQNSSDNIEWAMGWRTEKLVFCSQQGQEMFLFTSVPYLLLGAYQGSCTVGTVECFPAVKAAGVVKLTTLLHLMLRLNGVQLYLHSSIHLHSVIVKQAWEQLFFFYFTFTRTLHYWCRKGFCPLFMT